jgi:hypothetical protein
MAAVGIITTQLWSEAFMKPGAAHPAEASDPVVKIDRRSRRAAEGIA